MINITSMCDQTRVPQSNEFEHALNMIIDGVNARSSHNLQDQRYLGNRILLAPTADGWCRTLSGSNYTEDYTEEGTRDIPRDDDSENVEATTNQGP